MADYKEQIKALLSDPQKLLQKKPFYRGYSEGKCGYRAYNLLFQKEAGLNDTIEVSLPNIRKKVISQDQFMKELEPMNHDVLYDSNVPSITMKLDSGAFVEIKYKKMAVSFQKNIKNKQVLYLCGNQMLFSMMDTEPTEEQKTDFITFKQYWDLRNQDGMKTKMVDTQKSFGDAGLLYYFDNKKRIKSKILSYADGYILCPHNDDKGDRILESVYYTKDEIDYIDSYDDTYMYRHMRSYTDGKDEGWQLVEQTVHGFSEIPLVTKRGDVAWNDAQSIIEDYEVLYNIFIVIQKRHGWGILYIKGDFESDGSKIAGSVILNSKSSNYGDGVNNTDDAKFLTPPTPQGTLDTLQLMEETIQKCASTTFILPKDIKMSGDISGIAIMLTQSMDIENALQGVIEWQNVASKMTRLFKEGLAKELVNLNIQPDAITRFKNLHINGKFNTWQPKSDSELIQRLAVAKGAGFLSEESAIDQSPDSMPDEKARIKKEKEQAIQEELNKAEQSAQINAKYSKTNNKKEE